MSRLIGDVGGTNTRLALVDQGLEWKKSENFRNDDYQSLEEIVKDYLSRQNETVTTAAFSVAGPVKGGQAHLTNRDWAISDSALAKAFNWDSSFVVNDFSAVALGIPALTGEHTEQLGGHDPDPDAPVAILGPGTGLGIGALVPGRSGSAGRILVTEGGHASAASIDDLTSAVIAELRGTIEHVSYERLLSGQGIENLYKAISAIDGQLPQNLDAAQIGQRSLTAGPEDKAKVAMDTFFALLGSVAGDLALLYGAFGGVYIAGGIVPRYVESWRNSRFRDCFEAKGRMGDYVREIPVFLILHPEVELLGLAAYLRASENSQPWPMV